MDIEVGKKLIPYAIIFIVLFFLAMQLQGLRLEEHVSESYASFYYDLVIMGMAGLLFTAIFAIKYGDVLGLSKGLKLGIIGVWIFFIFMISFSGQQIIPVPKASVQTFQLNSETELYTSSVVPAITEDWAYLWVLPLVLLLAMSLGLEYGLGWEITRDGLIVLAVIACLIASVGYNIWVIPGFTSAHVPAYGNTQVAYTGAFAFSFGQSMVYVFTGWFLPVAHGIHNFMITYGQVYQISAGGLTIVGG